MFQNRLSRRRQREVFNGRVQLDATVHPDSRSSDPGVSVQLAPSPSALPVWAGSVAHTRRKKEREREGGGEREQCCEWCEGVWKSVRARGEVFAERVSVAVGRSVGRRDTSVFNRVSLVNQTRVIHSWNWLKTQDKNISKLVKFLLRMFY